MRLMYKGRTSYTTMWLALCRGIEEGQREEEEGGRRRTGGVENRNEINFTLDLTSLPHFCLHSQ